MEFRKSQWTESISSLLRKTEMNLIRIQTPYHEEIPRSYTSMGYQPSYYENLDHHPRPQTELKDDSLPFIQQDLSSIKVSLEKMLQDKIKSQKKDIESIGERLIALELGNQDIDKLKEETKTSLNMIEKKCLAEIKRIENSAKGFVTHEDVKIATESIKNANIKQIKEIEANLQHIKSGENEIKEEVYRMTEEKIREMSKKFISPQEFNNLKDQGIKESNQKLKDFEILLEEKLENFKIENEKQSLDFDRRLEEINKKYEKNEENLYKKIFELENASEISKIKYNEDIKILKSEIAEVQELINSEEIEAEISIIKKQITSLPKSLPEPDLSNYATKQDLKLLMDKLAESNNSKRDIDQKIFDIEKRIINLESNLSESDESNIDLAPKQTFANKGGATFGKNETQEENPGYTKIFINDLGDSDSESHGYISPHTSPMNQIPIGITKSDDRKNNQFDFKHKTDLHIKKTDLVMINEDPLVENKSFKSEYQENTFKKTFETAKKLESENKNNLDPVQDDNKKIKYFPVESVKVDNKKNTEEVQKTEIKIALDSSSNQASESDDFFDYSSKLDLKKKPLEPIKLGSKQPEKQTIPESKIDKFKPELPLPVPSDSKFDLKPKEITQNIIKPEIQIPKEIKNDKIESEVFKIDSKDPKLESSKPGIPKLNNEEVQKSNKDPNPKGIPHTKLPQLSSSPDKKIPTLSNQIVSKPPEQKVPNFNIDDIDIEVDNKKLKPLPKKQSYPENNPNINSFIQEFTENFIDEEINFGCREVSNKKNVKPLGIPERIKGMPIKQIQDFPSISSSDPRDSRSELDEDFEMDQDYLPY